MAGLPAPVRDAFLVSIANATSSVFWWSVAFAAVVPVLAWFIREVPLRTSLPEREPEPEPEPEPALAESRPTEPARTVRFVS